MSSNYVGIRYFSEMNPWIDFVVFVAEKSKDIVKDCIMRTMDAFWDNDYECYGNLLLYNLSKSGLKCDDYYILHYDEDLFENLVRLIPADQHEDAGSLFEKCIAEFSRQFKISIEGAWNES